MLLYLDSNVFISLMKREVGRNIRGLFVEAELFFDKVVQRGHIVALSDLFFREVEQICYLNKDEVLKYFQKICVKTLLVEFNKKIRFEEFAKIGIHFPDSLHVAIAVHYNCDCIVTFNLKDFSKASEKIPAFSPGNFY